LGYRTLLIIPNPVQLKAARGFTYYERSITDNHGRKFGRTTTVHIFTKHYSPTTTYLVMLMIESGKRFDKNVSKQHRRKTPKLMRERSTDRSRRRKIEKEKKQEGRFIFI
jgi:hypothetical protein